MSAVFLVGSFVLEVPAHTGIHTPSGLDVAAKGLLKVAVKVRTVAQFHRAAELDTDPSVAAALYRGFRCVPIGVVRVHIACELVVERDACIAGAALRLLANAEAYTADEAVKRLLVHIHAHTAIVCAADISM